MCQKEGRKMNNSYISGNVGKDPEKRQTQSGVVVATYSVGVYRPNPKDKDKPLTDWFNIVAWGDQANQVLEHVKKGSKVLLTGKFQTRNYDDKDGKKVYVTEFMQDSLWLAPKKEDTGSTIPESEMPF